ncbi:hypothetical protein EVAR_85423_1 [Eumeta japonica]|uniref:Uncharacterized protein n=1 Tax=Eumeta variegata TaxID=151549 RepID=A0A4C1WL39_EUMVA|nr:hypothetical protein EVAR_85423_1 [Eumeta japonica]
MFQSGFTIGGDSSNPLARLMLKLLCGLYRGTLSPGKLPFYDAVVSFYRQSYVWSTSHECRGLCEIETPVLTIANPCEHVCEERDKNATPAQPRTPKYEVASQSKPIKPSKIECINMTKSFYSFIGGGQKEY